MAKLPSTSPKVAPLRPVFISYNSLDKEIVGSLVKQLKAEHILLLWDQAVTAALSSKDLPLRLEVMKSRYAWIRDHLGADAALPAVGELAALLAHRRQHAGEYVAALNELGNTLQELKRFDEARPHYQKALKVLDRVDDLPLRASVLNNLGELWRKTDQFAKARG